LVPNYLLNFLQLMMFYGIVTIVVRRSTIVINELRAKLIDLWLLRAVVYFWIKYIFNPY